MERSPEYRMVLRGRCRYGTDDHRCRHGQFYCEPLPERTRAGGLELEQSASQRLLLVLEHVNDEISGDAGVPFRDVHEFIDVAGTGTEQ